MVSTIGALVYAIALGLIGFALLCLYVNVLTASVAFFGFIFYVVFYSLAKRTSHWGALVGSISGAVPIVVGYTAVTGKLDGAALILFLILAAWQMPHFYAIAIYRLDEYKKAGIPVFPAQKGRQATKIHILWYIILYIIATCALTVFGYAGHIYLAVMLIIGFAWLWRGIQGFRVRDNAVWARKLFVFSLIVLVVFSVMLTLASLVP
jgi:protoheme IX farnesyltransferase